MAKLTFVGGIHPYDGKDLSKDKPIQDVLPKGEMVYPLSQHIGAPAKPIVAKGDRVLAGQKIAESGGFVSAPIYASVSGTVKTIETRRVVTGDLIQSIVIDNDGLYESEEFHPYAPVDKLQKEESASVRAEIRPSPSLRIRAMLSPTSRLTARALARRSPTPLRMSAEPIPSRLSL